MNVDKLYSELFTEIHTVTESWDLMHQIDNLIESIFNTKMTFTEKLDLYLEFSIKNNILLLLEKSGVDTGDSKAVEKFLNDLKLKIKAIPTFELHIAYDPNMITIKHLAEWIYFNLHQNVLIDVKVDTALIAGGIIGFNGKMGDFTLKKKILDKYGPTISEAGSEAKTAEVVANPA
jgi:F0F1-type ATP synthase delta subunit